MAILLHHNGIPASDNPTVESHADPRMLASVARIIFDLNKPCYGGHAVTFDQALERAKSVLTLLALEYKLPLT